MRVIYEDDSLIAVEKPHGMLSVRGILPEATSSSSSKRIRIPRYIEWNTAIKHAADIAMKSSNSEDESKYILKKLSDCKTVPRKKKLFVNFMVKTMKISDEGKQDRIWDIISTLDDHMHKRKFSDIPAECISAVDILEERLGHSIYAVHRLDQETSGVLLFSKSAGSCREVSRQFRDREVRKEYVAKVAGPRIDATRLLDGRRISIPIRADIDNRPMQVVDYYNGKASESLVSEVKHCEDGWSLVKLVPLTGRTHQLRLHMSALGHPMHGDSLYAPPEVRAKSARLCLHSMLLALTHPVTGAPLELRAAEQCSFLDAGERELLLAATDILA